MLDLSMHFVSACALMILMAAIVRYCVRSGINESRRAKSWLLPILLVDILLCGCRRTSGPHLFPVNHGENTDYIDRSGKVRFSVKGDGGGFSDGLAPVNVWKKCCVEPRWGYVDESGRFTIEPQFDNAAEFSEGLAAVELADQVGYIDRTGRLVIPYGNSFVCRQGYSEAEELSKRPRASKPGSLFSFHDGFAVACLSAEHLAFIDRTGKVALPGPFVAVNPFEDGMAGVMHNKPTLLPDQRCSFVDKNGHELPVQFNFCGQFSEGLAPVVTNNHWGYIDHSGKLVISPQFLRAAYFTEGLAPVAIAQDKTLKWGFIDHSGRFAIPARYDTVGHFSEGLAVVGMLRMRDGRPCDTILGYIGKEGKSSINPQFNWLAGAFHGGLAQAQQAYVSSDCAMQASSGGWIDTSGKHLAWQVWLDDSGKYVPQR
jgi:hypothetical protein